MHHQGMNLTIYDIAVILGGRFLAEENQARVHRTAMLTGISNVEADTYTSLNIKIVKVRNIFFENLI